jgi:two-component system phosphate regulon sensor histidine kinase PhoR
MKLKKKIQNSMILVVLTSLILTYGTMIFVVYYQTMEILKNEIQQEADYIEAAVCISGVSYLEDMDAVRENTRVTLIDASGEVLYDSGKQEEHLENHLDRPEIQEALKSGSGQDVRRSETLDQDMFYYAVRLDNGTVLRVSKNMETVFSTAMSILPMMGVVACCMVIFALLLAKWQTAKLIYPINHLNLAEPLENDMYEELTPLLQSIDKQNREKDAVANMRKEFSANVSHELKTPLTSISGYAEIMKDGLVRPEDMKTFSERIYNEASRLITLVEDIMKLSKLDEGAVELEKEEVDFYMLTREICSRLAPQAEKRHVRVEVTGEPVHYLGVRQVLDEMLYNMIENAIKYNKEGGLVSVWVGNTLQGIKIIVRDTGIGIPKEEQKRIFERFYRVDKSHSKATGGTGLGLSIVKHGALMHGAKIHVESEVNKGTKMELIF